jgi:DNA-directed RNA polymerase specialized sigma24 family protein
MARWTEDPECVAIAERWGAILSGATDPPKHDARASFALAINALRNPNLSDARRLAIARRVLAQLGAPVHAGRWGELARRLGYGGEVLAEEVREQALHTLFEAVADLFHDLRMQDVAVGDRATLRAYLERRQGRLVPEALAGEGWRSGPAGGRAEGPEPATPAPEAALVALLDLLAEDERRQREPLSKREAEALLANQQGARSPAALAGALGVTPANARVILHRLRQKLALAL